MHFLDGNPFNALRLLPQIIENFGGLFYLINYGMGIVGVGIMVGATWFTLHKSGKLTFGKESLSQQKTFWIGWVIGVLILCISLGGGFYDIIIWLKDNVGTPATQELIKTPASK